MEDKMELLALVHVLLISGCSNAMHPGLTFKPTSELDKQHHLRSKHLKYVFVPGRPSENRVENVTAESTGRQRAEQEKRSEKITPRPVGKPVEKDKMEEGSEGGAGLSSQTDSNKERREEIRGRVAGIRERKGGARKDKKGQMELKKLRKAAKEMKNRNQEEVRDRRVVNHTTAAQQEKKSSIQTITRDAPPPQNGSRSPPFAPTQVPPLPSHPPTLYTRVRVHFSPPSVNTAGPTSSSHTSDLTVRRGVQGGKVKSDFVFGIETEVQTLKGEKRKINTSNQLKNQGNISTPQTNPREGKETNRFRKLNESVFVNQTQPAQKPNRTAPPTDRPGSVHPAESHARVTAKQSRSSIRQTYTHKPGGHFYQTTAKTPTQSSGVNKSRTTKTWKDEGNKSQSITPSMEDVNLLTSFPFMDDYCPPVCVCYDGVVQCANKSVGKVPHGIPYGARQILLMNNYIKGIPLDLFAKYSSVEVLVLSNNWLTDGAIKGAFREIPSLKHLYLDGNRLRSVPDDLPAALEELRLDNNYLKEISEGAWSRCPGLFVLRLSNNNLGHGPDSFPDAVLSSLRNLHTLSLNHNQLTAIPLGLPALIKELYLRGNLLEQVGEDAFQKMRALEVLDLSANRLTNAGLRNSVNATRLESLNLEGNRLEQVPRHLPPSLKSLNLEGNFISSIKKADFSKLKKLELLGLARNKIFEVTAGAFRELPSLHRLDLCHNALQRVPRQLPRRLHSIALTSNKVHSVPHDAFCWGSKSRSFRGFVQVHLEHNLIDVGKIDARSFRCLKGFQLVHSY